MVTPKITRLPVNNQGIPFFVFQVEDHLEISKLLIQHAYDLHNENSNEISYQGEKTWHSIDTLHLDNRFTSIKTLFDTAIHLLWQEKNCSKSDYNWEYMALWANISNFGNRTFPHTHWGHAESIFGGVYYPVVPKNSGALRLFSPDRKLRSVGGFDLYKVTPFNIDPHIDLEVKSGQMVIFPNWIGHGVLPNLSLKDRISYTFLAKISQFPIANWPQTPELPKSVWDKSFSGFE